MKLVVDASVAIKWVVQEPGSEFAVQVLDHELSAPDLLISECANILWKKQRHGELAPAVAEAVVTALTLTGVVLVGSLKFLPAIHRLSVRLDRPAYDCTYLALAVEQQCALVTADRRLVQRCREADAKDLARHVIELSEFK